MKISWLIILPLLLLLSGGGGSQSKISDTQKEVENMEKTLKDEQAKSALIAATAQQSLRASRKILQEKNKKTIIKGKNYTPSIQSPDSIKVKEF